MRWLWVFLCFSITQAQNLYVAVTANNHLGFEPEIRLENFSLDDSKINLRLAYQEAIEFGVLMRQTTSFGPAGNVALEGQASVATNGDYQLALEARGVIASLAANVKGQLFDALPERFELSKAFASNRPRYKQGLALEFGLSYRLSRNEILSAYPSIFFLQEGFAAQLEANYKRFKLLEPHDGSFLLQAYLSPEGKGYGALGFQINLNDRKLPSLSASTWLSLGSQGFLPGLKANLRQSFKSVDGELDLSLGLEPYRSDFLPYYLQASYVQALGSGHLETHLYTTLGARDISPVTLTVGYRYSF